jgi:hypothetical protein
MALLKRSKSDNPITNLERELTGLQSRRAVLDQRLGGAASELAQAFDQRRQVVLESDLSDQNASTQRDKACRTAHDKHESLLDALGIINGKIADVETLLIAARDRAARTENAKAIEADIAALVAARSVFEDAAQKLLVELQPLTTKVPVNPDWAPGLARIIGEVPLAIDEFLSTARSHVAGIINGTSHPVRPPSPPTPEPPPQHVERQRIFALNHLRWKEGEQTILAAKFSWASPPKHLAERACAHDVADWPGSERVARMIVGFGISNAVTSPDLCIDLDAIDAAAAAEPQIEQPPRGVPEFQERIGKTRTGAIAVSRT